MEDDTNPRTYDQHPYNLVTSRPMQNEAIDFDPAKRSFAAPRRTRNVTTETDPLSLRHFLTGLLPATGTATESAFNLTFEEASKGREPILSILKDAGIKTFQPSDIVLLPLWSSVSELYYGNKEKDDKQSNKQDSNDFVRDDTSFGGDGPIILGLEGCKRFREQVPAENRFLGVAGNFNSGTTAFGIVLQKNCRLVEHDPANNWQIQRGRGSRKDAMRNVYGMLNHVPWSKHKSANYRGKTAPLPPPASSIVHDHVLPIVLVRDPFYWMQSMCKEGYGVRWDHDSRYHCPNLVPNDFDKRRFSSKKHKQQQEGTSVPVWMGPSPTSGSSWPSLIHYWNDWYESYYHNNNHKDGSGNGVPGDRTKENLDEIGSNWPRLIIRFEDTLFYPQQVMAKVCHCGGGRLTSEWDSVTNPSSKGTTGKSLFEYSFEEAKPHHKKAQNNFVTSLIQYGTNATRLRNMTEDDLRFAIENLNPTLMKAFGYAYPNIPSLYA